MRSSLPGGIDRDAGHLAPVVDRDGSAYDVSGQRAQVGHTAVLPKECVLVSVACDVGGADDLAAVVDGEGRVLELSAQTAEVNGLAVAPQQGVPRLQR